MLHFVNRLTLVKEQRLSSATSQIDNILLG